MKEETLKGSFKYDPTQETYNVCVKRQYQWWWWLLLLLLFLPLFIRCSHTVEIKVVNGAGEPVSGAQVDVESTAHYFLAHSESIELNDSTDKHGIVRFTDMKCSLYCYLFHRKETLEISVTPPPSSSYLEKSESVPFHSSDKVKIVLDEKPLPVDVQVVDAMNNNPLSGADVVVSRSGSAIGTYLTNGNGIATIPGIRPSDKLSLAGSKTGYEPNDSTLGSVRGHDLMVTPARVIPLVKRYECNDDITYDSQGAMSVTVDMHKSSGTFSVEFLTYAWPDQLEIFNADGTKIFDSGMGVIDPYPQTFTGIRFNSQKLTFKVTPDPLHPMDSMWKLHPFCPD